MILPRRAIEYSKGVKEEIALDGVGSDIRRQIFVQYSEDSRLEMVLVWKYG